MVFEWYPAAAGPTVKTMSTRLAKFVSLLRSLAHSKLAHHDRPLEDIGTRSQALPEKGKIVRILDKAQDTGEVVKLIERLR